jgi:predicted nuclease of predicted toxin-antitoxin system
MSLALYMDVHVPAAIADGLKARGVDVLTAQSDRSTRLEDSLLLDRSTALNRVLFTMDQDFLRETAMRQRAQKAFAGVIFIEQAEASIGSTINDLELIAKAGEPEDMTNILLRLPL